jgi:hypothetical protein
LSTDSFGRVSEFSRLGWNDPDASKLSRIRMSRSKQRETESPESNLVL